MSPEQANKIYDVLAVLVSAPESCRESFIYHHVRNDCHEFRFGGALGFGGKYWVERNQVTYYAEDETPKLKAIVAEVNAKLKELGECA
jgi:hypothetical protein